MMSSPTVNKHNSVYNSFTEENALTAIAKKSETSFQHQREFTRQAHQIRRRELEKNARNNDTEDTSSSFKSNKTKNSLLLETFLNGDIDIRTIEQHDLKRLLSELELKYKSSMIINSSLFNEKQSLSYQIDIYKDTINDNYEILNELKRQLKEKCKDFDLQKQKLIHSEENNNQLKDILNNFQKLIDESDNNEGKYSSNDLNQSIEDKLKQILYDKQQQYKQILKLKFELEQEKNRLPIFKEPIVNSIDLHHQNINYIADLEQQKQLNRQINDLKNQLQRIEADNGSLLQENKRYEAQLTRYKQELDDTQRVEDELKQERRGLQRELRITRDELENERTMKTVLQRENERLRLLRKKNLLNNSDDNLVSSRSHSPLLPTNSPIENSN